LYLNYRVSTLFGKSWNYSLDFAGPGKYWRMNLVLENPGN